MELRNCILIALALNATPNEVDAAHDAIDRAFSSANSVTPAEAAAGVSTTLAAMGNSGIPAPSHEAADNTLPAADVPSAGTAELDKDGLPWDERIHSSNRKMTDKGVWRAKRNVAADLKAKVEAELRATLGAAPAAPAPAAPTAPAPLPGAGLPPMPGAAMPDPAYTALVALIAQNTQSASNPGGRITDDWVKQVLTHYGVADGNLQNLAHNLALVPAISEYITGALAS